MQNKEPEGVQSIPAAQEVGMGPNPRFHGSEPVRGLEGLSQSALKVGRFGRLFRHLTPFEPEDEDLEALGDTMFEPEPDDNQEDPAGDNPDIPSGFTYFGQFIDHDITFDPNSKLQRQNDPNALVDFRTPRFDLDSLYGAGPDNDPFRYEPDGLRLLVEKNYTNDDDLPRNSQGRALIGDPRNDENLIVSGLQSAFFKFHNKVVDTLEGKERVPADQLFDEARQVVRWHYQWVVVHDFLKTVVGRAVVNDILKFEEYVVLTEDSPQTAVVPKVDLKFYHWENEPFIPVEFSVAAYRFGHSMVRPDYTLNELTQEVPIFSNKVPDLRGFRQRPANTQIEWERFFKFPEHLDPENGFPQPTRKIDTKLAFGLSILPAPIVNPSPEDKKDPKRAVEFAKLAVRNLLRGKALGLPTGQDVARAMGIPAKFILTKDQIAIGDLRSKFASTTPLWYYILKEAEVLNMGKKLGPVGGRIVAEVFIGLLHGDPLSYLSIEPTWRPTPGRFGAREDGEFTMADLLRFAIGR
jgi:hypothetical protein